MRDKKFREAVLDSRYRWSEVLLHTDPLFDELFNGDGRVGSEKESMVRPGWELPDSAELLAIWRMAPGLKAAYDSFCYSVGLDPQDLAIEMLEAPNDQHSQ